MNTIREQMLDFLTREIVGPDPIPPDVQENGEEILSVPPRHRYGAGVLFPQAAESSMTDAVSDSEMADYSEEQVGIDDELISEANETDVSGTDDGDATELDANDETISLANAYLPSAMGISCVIKNTDKNLLLLVTAGRYFRTQVNMTDGRRNVTYNRQCLDQLITVHSSEAPSRPGDSIRRNIVAAGEPTGLIVEVRNRTPSSMRMMACKLLTVSLVNELRSDGAPSDSTCFFQCGLRVESETQKPIFLQYPAHRSERGNDDARSFELLFRNRLTYAVGHGCAGNWRCTENGVVEVRTDILPAYELKPIVPAVLPETNLLMRVFSDHSGQETTFGTLTTLCSEYQKWIEKQKQKVRSSDLAENMHETALRHLQHCEECLQRMHGGIELLRTDTRAFKAFCLMNEAMLTQQIRYSIPLRKWSVEEGHWNISPLSEPKVDQPETWMDWSEVEQRSSRLGRWRPFQIGFILMNLRSMAEPDCTERRTVDLIWFPTGGGKTEAYLGLAAFTIFCRRLANPGARGTSVLMRYTLRLLTSQQYNRAASLICACENIRRKNSNILGDERVRIGLWVGRGLTPNTRQEALRAQAKLTRDPNAENPFMVLKCPWCGAQMGPVIIGRSNRTFGYRRSTHPTTVHLRCPDSDCLYSGSMNPLPLMIVDEDIYESPPDLLIGTVDKFAMLAWKPESGAIFGKGSDWIAPPPDLVIQDELHLISGPLGSMVGHYETIVEELCRQSGGVSSVGPKIIASTATISRAREQVTSLYARKRNEFFQFPPHGIDYGNSFFAFEDNETTGRLYVGVHASALPSHATSQIRVISALLQGAKSATVSAEAKRDPYWTILSYFNSLRELGHAATLVRADIREYLNFVYSRKRISKGPDNDPRRFVNRMVELTSRVSGTSISSHLQELEIAYQGADERAVDICLATNMISVGVDVQRLGLMTVIGQPKTTSEYIQATSRVGRSKDGPGLVVVIYNPYKPRDRSHYEHFYSYHSKIYGQVEAVSVTPFATPVRERALHALIVAVVRHLGGQENRENASPPPGPEIMALVNQVIRERVSTVDPCELEATSMMIGERFEEWRLYDPLHYGGFGPATEEMPLMYPAGSVPHENWQGASWSTPTSLRDVDRACEAIAIRRYDEPQGGD